MSESFYAVVIFWLGFGLSIGPFWIAVMEAAKHQDIKPLFKQYCIYLVTFWLALMFIIGSFVRFVGGFHPYFLILLSFVGGVVILYFAYKTIQSIKMKKSKINFNFISMGTLSFTNPKVWLTVPAGFLAANYTQTLFIDAALFYLTSVPIFICCFLGYAMIGKKGAKLAKGKLSYFNASMLVLFALYLFYGGVVEWQEFSVLIINQSPTS